MTWLGWALVTLCALAGAVSVALAGSIPNTAVRRGARLLLCVLPPLLYFALGISDGCFPLIAGERCYWFGMGMVVFAPFFLSWFIGGALMALRARVKARPAGSMERRL